MPRTLAGTRTVAGARTNTSIISNALQCLSASSQYAFVADASWQDGMAQLTVTAWVKKITAQLGGIIDHKRGSSWNIQCLSNNKIRVEMPVAGAADTADVLVTGVWTHIGFVYDGANVQPYLSGIANGTAKAKTGVIGGATTGIYFGRMDDGNYGNLILDEAHIWNTGLTAQEMLDDYNGILKTANLLAQYKFNNNQIIDEINGYNGKIFGAAIVSGYSHPTDYARRTG